MMKNPIDKGACSVMKRGETNGRIIYLQSK